MPAETEPMNVNMAIALGMPRLIRIGSTMTPMAITGPAPIMAVKIKAVTTLRRTMVMIHQMLLKQKIQGILPKRILEK